MPTVTELYESNLAERGYHSDPAQLRAIAALQPAVASQLGASRSAPMTSQEVRKVMETWRKDADPKCEDDGETVGAHGGVQRKARSRPVAGRFG